MQGGLCWKCLKGKDCWRSDARGGGLLGLAALPIGFAQLLCSLPCISLLGIVCFTARLLPGQLGKERDFLTGVVAVFNLNSLLPVAAAV